MNNRISKFFMIGSVLAFGACTDLEVKETDSKVVFDEEFGGVDAAGTLQDAYNRVAESNQQNLYALSEATTDELLIPTRGTDWGDNGVWRSLAKHTWTDAHTYNYKTWNYLNQTVYSTNQILHEATTKTATQEAEAKFLRAWNMFWIMDLWRQIPIREADEGPEINPRVLTGQEAFDFIVKDLEEAIPGLEDVKSGEIDKQKFASQASAHFLLAKLFLNKAVFTGAAVNNADMDRVISEVDAIEADGYALQSGFFSIFSPSADSETIFWSNAQYAHRIWGSLHYHQGGGTDNGGGGWNGFATTSEFFNKFEGPADTNVPESGQEERRGYVPDNGLGIGFLFGQQYGPDGKLKTRPGKDLIFTKDLSALTGQGEADGMRLLKYHPVINMPGTWGNHLMMMRWADALLMKAEAIFRKGDAGTALTLVNSLRTVRNATPLGALTEDDLIDERGRELYIEGWRRNDLVRFGKFNTNFGFVDNTDPSTNVFPVPANALGSNPNLIQNDGY